MLDLTSKTDICRHVGGSNNLFEKCQDRVANNSVLTTEILCMTGFTTSRGVDTGVNPIHLLQVLVDKYDPDMCVHLCSI